MTFAQLVAQNCKGSKPISQLPQIKAPKTGKAAGKGTIAASIIAGLRGGKSPQKVLALVLKKHQSNTTIACVYWYASRIKRGLIA